MMAALYLRISTQDKGQDTENQKIQLERYAKEQGWKIVRVYEDHASGATGSRTAYQRMFEDAEKGKFDVLLFWSLDRFSREGTFATLRDLHKLGQLGVKFHSLQEPYLDTLGVFRDAILGLLAAIARMERDRLAERVRAGLERARAQGRRVGRPPANIDMEALKRMLKEGRSVRQIAKRLGFPTTTIANRIKKLRQQDTTSEDTK